MTYKIYTESSGAGGGGGENYQSTPEPVNSKKEPVVVDATRWFKMGDHPAVKRPTANLDDACGLVDTPEGEQIVAPGDWVVTDDKGDHYVNKVYAKTADYPHPLEFIRHYVIGGNPNTYKTGGHWDTEQDAINAFAKEFAELAQEAQGRFLLVRTAPVCIKSAIFDSDEYKWRMIGRFSIAKLKEKNT